MSASRKPFRAAVLSDTHGLLRQEVLAACAGSDHILHAGDIGESTILDQLARVAPVTAIRGNIDTQGPCAKLPATELTELAGTSIYLVHALADLDIHPQAAGVRVVVSGHSHKSSDEWRDGVLYLNPGSAGPRRFRLPVAMAFLILSEQSITVERMHFEA